MAGEKYRYRLPDGQSFETTNLARLKRQHPGAHIVGRVQEDGTLAPYRGDQPGAKAAEVKAEAGAEPKAEKKRGA